MGLFQKKNLPNFTLIFCHSSVVAGTVVVAFGRKVGHWRYNPNAVVDKLGLMAVRCNFVEVGRDGLDVDIVLDCVLVGVDFWRVQLGAEEFSDPRLQLQRRLSFGVRLVC